MKKSASLAMILWCGAAAASDYSRVDKDINTCNHHIAELQQEFAKRPPAPSDKEWVKAKLAHMVEIDQYARNMTERSIRNHYTDDEQFDFNQRSAQLTLAIDRKNTSDLKELLKIYPWFKISEFGEAADKNGWLLVQHADLDAPFQRQVLEILEPLAAKAETDPKNFAYLYDRVASSFQNPVERKPQRYGTQGMCSGPGTWEPLPVEEPEKLDERRATVGLPPEAEYKKGFATICHESMEETMRRSIEAAKKKYGNDSIDAAPQQSSRK
jgi:hypothetical protein